MAFTTDLRGWGDRTAQWAGRAGTASRYTDRKRELTVEARVLRAEAARDAQARRLSAELELRLIAPLV